MRNWSPFNSIEMKRKSMLIKKIVFLPLIAALVCIRSVATGDPLEDFVNANLKSTNSYSEDITEYVTKIREKETIADADRIRYSNAYAYLAWDYYRKNDAVNSFKSASIAVTLSPKNPVSLFIAGYLYKIKQEYVNAVTYFRASSNFSKGEIKKSADTQLDLIAALLIDDARKLAKEKKFSDAGERLQFVATNFQGSRRYDATKLLESISDEITAAQMLSKAQQLIAFRSRGDAQRLLKEITTKYSWTSASEEAQKILRQSDDLFIKAKGESFFAELARTQKWKVLETTNFTIYYRNNDFAKEAARVIETVFSRVISELDLKDVSWRSSKCRIFLFDDHKTWSEFKGASGMASEWAAAFALPGEREIYGNAADGKTLLERNLPHEITHLIHGEYLGKGSIAPLWLTEGIAVHQQFDSKTDYYRIVQAYIESGNAISLEQLTQLPGYPSSGLHYFYAASMAFVEFIIEEYGKDTFVRLNRGFKGDQKILFEFKKICSRYLKEKPEVVEKKWLDFVRKKASVLK